MASSEAIAIPQMDHSAERPRWITVRDAGRIEVNGPSAGAP
jgi:hypothetical protein